MEISQFDIIFLPVIILSTLTLLRFLFAPPPTLLLPSFYLPIPLRHSMGSLLRTLIIHALSVLSFNLSHLLLLYMYLPPFLSLTLPAPPPLPVILHAPLPSPSFPVMQAL